MLKRCLSQRTRMDTRFKLKVLSTVIAIVVFCCQQTKGQDTCNCLNFSECSTYREQGCFPCHDSWSGSNCQTQNAALNQHTQLSTTYIDCGSPCDIRVANNAVNGIQTTSDPTKCAQTQNSTTGHYWSLRLPNFIDISRIRAFFPDTVGSLQGLEVLINGNLCYKASTATVGPDILCERAINGYNVTLYLPPDGYRVLAVCEVEVFVCGNGWYGSQCDKRCTCRNTVEVCNKVTGECSSGCPDGYDGTDCKVCADGRYGSNCSSICGNCRNAAVCHKTTGTCNTGCASGWFGPYCKTPCVDGRYGIQCAAVCGSCLNGDTCNKVTGACPTGCAPGYKGEPCILSCEPGRYGISCVSECGRCRHGEVCDKATGTCFQGCEAGWKGEKCDIECESGKYGMDCVESCGQCKDSVPCNKTSGYCSGGCQPGWIGNDCKTECPTYTYGDRCASICGRCRSNDVCNKVTGWCPNECQAGYQPPICSQECDDGKYGMNCLYLCGACKDGAACDKTSGRCSNGCQPGKTGDLCTTDCPDGQYGTGCSYSCGQCRDGDLCDKVTGTCPYGCRLGYNGTRCHTACPPGSYGLQCLKKCGHCLDLTQCDFATGLCPSGCQPGWTESNCNQVCTNKTYGKNCALKCGNCKVGDYCDKVTGHCPNGCSAGYKWEFCEQECDAGSFGADCSQTCGHCKDNAPCDHALGICPGLCEPGWQGPTCLTACPDGYFGTSCTLTCGYCKDKTSCDSTNGHCPDEACEPGWTSALCNTECPDGMYGSGCSSKCGACKGGAVCNRVTGQCPGDCELGWIGDDCNSECPDGLYGSRCQSRCGRCAVGTSCNKTNGICEDGCSVGYNGLLCNTVCRPGFFGDGCILVCGQCDSSNNLCNPVTGKCNSCRSGWKGDRCTRACDDGEYGPNCSLKCGACREGTTCAKGDGRCPSGCRPGSSGDNCTIACPEGRYGGGCTSECGRCKDTEACDTNTGHCPSGCQPSWTGVKCDQECANGAYGMKCENTCGKCSGSEPCDKISGACPFSCLDGFTGELCQEALPATENDTTGMIAGIVIGVLVMAAIVLVGIFCFIRRRRGKEPYSYTEDNVLKPLDNVDKSTRGDNDHQSLSRVSMASSRNRSEINLPFETTFDIESTLGLSIPTVISSTVSASEMSGPSIGVDDDALDIQSVNSEYDWPTDEDTSTAFAVYEIGEHIEMKMAAGGFENEFSMLPNGMRFPHTVGLLPDNVSKNRYPRSLPYDDNRVFLVNSDPHESDYINASHIDGFRVMEEYIACEGPLEQTANDFWRMVWDKKVCKIVMLGRTRENGKSKCYKYWPDVKDGQTYGELSVTCNRVVSRAHQTMREFYIYDHQGAEKRLVTQYQFISWPEGGFPSPPVFVSFIKQVTKTETSRWPTVVHCSSGIGRTGCFIAINAMAEQARMEPEIDVFKYVCRMRLQRPEMVRTRLQYAGVHQALHDMLASKETLLSTGELMEKYRSTAFKSLSSNSVLGSEFQTLDEMRPVLSPEETQVARRPENIRKNRSIDILPGSQHRVILKGNAVKPGHYINAVYLPSVLFRRGFIITQQPLTHTVEQFWTLVQEQESVTIVSLTPTDLNPLVRKGYGEYMPRSNGQALSVGKYEILLKSTVNTREEIPEKTLILRTKGTGDFTPSRHIKVFSVPDWSAGEDIPSSKHVLLILLEALVKRQKDAGQHPIIVHCLDGASRSGLFCVVSNIISRLKLDREVDIFLTVRELQCIRPAIITSFTQYSFCYEVARNFIRNTEHS